MAGIPQPTRSVGQDSPPSANRSRIFRLHRYGIQQAQLPNQRTPQRGPNAGTMPSFLFNTHHVRKHVLDYAQSRF